VSEPVSLETRVSRNTNDIEALYGLVQMFEGRTRTSFARVNQRFDDLAGKVDRLEGKVDGLQTKVDGLEGKVDCLVSQLGEVLSLLRKQGAAPGYPDVAAAEQAGVRGAGQDQMGGVMSAGAS